MDDLIKTAHELGLLSSSESLEDVTHKIRIGFAITDAIVSYIPEPWRGNIYQMSAEEFSRDMLGNLCTTRGWEFMDDLQPKNIVIGGNHETIMTPPNIQVLASKISQMINDC